MKPIPALTKEQLEHFWSQVDKSGECWLWTGRTHTNGDYGLMCLKGGGDYRANRLSYTIARGDPGRHFVCHTCDTPGCVNPSHLWVGTHQDNMDDKVDKGRQSKGESHGMSRLTEKQVREILRLEESHQALADRYNVSLPTISGIKHGKNWNHIEETRKIGLRPDNKTGVTGVSIYKGRYRARLWRNKKSYCLGLFDTIEEAAQAITKKRLELSCETD